MDQNQSSVKLKRTDITVAIVVSEYNREIADTLKNSCVNTLRQAGMKKDHVEVVYVPGAFELPYQCQQLAQMKKCDVIIALGAIIKGETPHFDIIAQACVNGIMNVSLKHDIPIVFGVLTTLNIKQARDRIENGKHGNKGLEAAQTAIQLLNNNR